MVKTMNSQRLLPVLAEVEIQLKKGIYSLIKTSSEWLTVVKELK